MRRCLTCSALFRPPGSHCPKCERGRRQFRNAEADRCRAAVEVHRASFGDWCPGYGAPSHASSDLTADHVDGRVLGSRLVVLCRGCNARKGAVDAAS